MAVAEKSLANLRPQAFTSERAREAARKSAEVRRKRAQERQQAKEQAEQAAIQDLARLAYKRLFQLLQDENTPERWLGAAREALDRAEGKPTQRVETSQSEARPYQQMTSEELQARLAELGGLHAVTSSPPKAQSE